MKISQLQLKVPNILIAIVWNINIDGNLILIIYIFFNLIKQ
jgi:hypothetical protein